MQEFYLSTDESAALGSEFISFTQRQGCALVADQNQISFSLVRETGGTNLRDLNPHSVVQ